MNYAYLIPVEDDCGSDDYSDKEFQEIARRKGNVFTLSEFQDWYNYESEVVREDWYVRFFYQIN
jgi:hypothetical protein